MQQASKETEARFELNFKAKNGSLIPNEINCRYISYWVSPVFYVLPEISLKLKCCLIN